MTGIEGVAVSIYDDTARALRAERISRDEDPSLYEIGREVLGLDDKQARALFQGPNTAGSARRWIGTQAAADACRALADGTAPEKLWDGKFDRLAVATAAAREAGAANTDYWQSSTWEIRGIAPGATVHPTASIADDVQIDNGAYIGENVRLESGVHVAQGATIEHGTVVRSACIVGERSHIHPNCVIDGHVGDGVQIEAGARIGRKRQPEHEGSRSGTTITVCAGAVVGKGVTIDKPGTVVPRGWAVSERNVESLPARDTETSVEGTVERADPPTWENREPGSWPPGVSREAEIAPSAVVHPGAQIAAGAKIHKDSEIGRGARIEPGASIGRATRIGPGARVGAGSVVEDEVDVRPGATIEPDCLAQKENHDRRRRRGPKRNRLRKRGTEPPGGRSDCVSQRPDGRGAAQALGGACANPPQRPRPPDGVDRSRRNDRRGRMHRREHPNRGRGADRAPRACGNRCRDGGRKPRGRRRGHTRERIRRSRSGRRRMERHRRRRAGRDTRQRRRERQSQSRNRSPGPPDGVPERDVRRNGAPCRRDRTGTARNRTVRQNRARTDTVRIAHQKLIGRSRAAGQLGRAEQGGSHAGLRRRRGRRKRGLNSPKANERLGATVPDTKREPNGGDLGRNAARDRHASTKERVSPHARGSPRLEIRLVRPPASAPARTGLHPRSTRQSDVADRSPRTHGDRPPLEVLLLRSRADARARTGIDPKLEAACSYRSRFPARMGINRALPASAKMRWTVPRTHGDAP